MSPFMGGGSNSSIVIVVIAWAFIIGSVVGYLSLRFVIAMTLRKYLRALPEEFREPPEVLIWMSIVPGLPCLLNFFTLPMLAHSYRKALEVQYPGGVSGLTLLTVAAWLYPVLYLIAFLPYVAPNAMPDKLDSMFEVSVYFALMFSDVIVFVFLATQFDKLEKHLRAENASDSHVSARHRNVMERLSRD